MTIEKKLLGTNPVSGEVLPEAVSFDGHLGNNNANDYLSRTTPLTNQADSKTFTFSTWAWLDGANGGLFYLGNNKFFITFEGGGDYFKCEGRDASNVRHLRFEAPTGLVPVNTWVNILMSFDMSNTSKRHIYINEVDITSATFTGSFPTYTDGTLDFTPSAGSGNADMSYRIGAQYSAQSKLGGRLAHFFFDYTYRDLSVTANRRLFIDADGKPADTDTLAAVNPVLYLPMTDAATAGSNSGTGGDFTAVGVLATAERGPNQDNCSASVFDGSNDYMRRTSLTGAADGKQFTVSFNLLEPVTSGNRPVFSIGAGNNQVFFARFANAGGGKSYLTFAAYQAGAPTTFVATFAVPVLAYRQATGTQNSVQISVDVTDTSKRHVYINGVALPDSWTTYNNASMDFTGDKYTIGATAFDSAKVNGSMGEVYFNTAYIDLDTDNPFWDSDTNRPNSVRKVIADTGVTPLVALPIMGNDAGNNLGSGGNFTVTSGPYTGARGGSEFWARSASKASDNGNYLSRGPVVASSTTTYSGVAFAKGTPSTAQLGYVAKIGGHFELSTQYNDVSVIRLSCASTGSTIGQTVDNYDPSVWNAIFFGIDTGGNIYLRVREVEGTSSASAGGTINLQNEDVYIMAVDSGSTTYGFNNIGFLYFDDSYIDFSQEANRNKFIDQLGYPKDLGADGSEPTGSSPLIYMKFDDTAALGTNSGTGGNFTVNGTVTAGADVDP